MECCKNVVKLTVVKISNKYSAADNGSVLYCTDLNHSRQTTFIEIFSYSSIHPVLPNDDTIV